MKKINNMNNDFIKEQQYLKAKKRVKAMKEFYRHLISYIVINLFISAVILYGLVESGYPFVDALGNFGVYSVWVFWGIGLFFHWLGVFGFNSIGFGKNWEDRKIKQMMDKDRF